MGASREGHMTIKCKRALIKLSGGALAGESGLGLDRDAVDDIVGQIKKIRELGVEVGIVVGGGNFWRGRMDEAMDRTTSDHMGMLATAINALALQDALEKAGVETRVQTALTISRVAEPYILRRALRHFEKGRAVIFACGTGNPYFTTDTAAALRAAEIHADVLMMAKNVDGIYDKDPSAHKDAVKLDEMSHIDYISRGLKAIDTTAVSLCMENGIGIVLFGLKEKDSIVRAASGEAIGTAIRSKTR